MYRLVIIFSGSNICEEVYNDKDAAEKAFRTSMKNPYAIGINLYECVFVNNHLENKHRYMNWVK